MNTYLLTLGKGLKGPARMNGALFLGEKTLYFLTASLGLTGGYEFGAFGAVGASLEEYKKTGTEPAVDEGALAALVSSTEHSFAIPADKIELLSKSFWSGSKIVHDGGQKLVVWNPGFAGPFRDTIRQWAQSRGVQTKGL
jgi:hypothetical protein